MFGLDVNRWNLEGSEDGGSITEITKLQVSSDNHPKPSSCQGSILPSMCPYTILTYTLINSQNKLLKKKKSAVALHTTNQWSPSFLCMLQHRWCVPELGSGSPAAPSRYGCYTRWGCRADFASDPCRISRTHAHCRHKSTPRSLPSSASLPKSC